MSSGIMSVMQMRSIGTLAGAAAFLLALSACGSDDGTTATDGTTPAASGSSPVDGATAAPGDYPSFGADDYTYTLEMACYCPLTMPIRVSVADGEVVDAVAAQDGGRIRKGAQVPEAGRLTIDDIIDAANDPGVDEVEVDWPTGQAWPDEVRIDRIAAARDDEVGYRISDVDVG